MQGIDGSRTPRAVPAPRGRQAAATSVVALALRVSEGAVGVGLAAPAAQTHGAWPKPGAKGFLSDWQTVPVGGVISLTR